MPPNNVYMTAMTVISNEYGIWKNHTLTKMGLKKPIIC
jgi:hypothetical protein